MDMPRDPRPVGVGGHGWTRWAVYLGTGLFLASLSTGLAHAAGVVTDCSTYGPGAGTLQDALGGGGTVTFACSGTIIVPEIVITTDTTIDATGQAVTLSGNNANRVFRVDAAHLELVGVTVTGGWVSDLHGPTDSGGGLYAINAATLTLTDSAVIGNSASASGGGLFVGQGSTATLTNSTVSGNSAVWAGSGGGIAVWGATLALTNGTLSGNWVTQAGGGLSVGGYAAAPATVTLTNSTVSDNSALFDGGGITVGGGETVLTLTNSSVSGNSARVGGGLYTRFTQSVDTVALTLENTTVSGNLASDSDGGGALFVESGPVVITNSTLSWNSGPGGTGGIFGNSLYGPSITLRNSIVARQAAGRDCGRSVTSDGYNIDSDGTCGLTDPTDQPSTNPWLGPLQDNGGPTQTHALGLPSVAIDAIPVGTNGCGTDVATDQRGVTRPQGAGCDIGAYETARYNVLTNRSFEDGDESDSRRPAGWEMKNFRLNRGEGRRCVQAHDGDCSVRMRARGEKNRLFKDIVHAGQAGDWLGVRLWTKTRDVAGVGVCGAHLEFFHADGTRWTAKGALCGPGTRGWEEAWPVSYARATQAYTKVRVIFLFDKPEGSVWIDDVRLLLTPRFPM